MGGVVLIALTFIAMWALFIVPQQRRVKAQRALVSALQVGDDVMTTSGLFGTITEMEDDEVRLQVADGVEVRFARGAIASRVADDIEPEPDDDDVEAGDRVEPDATDDLPVDD